MPLKILQKTATAIAIINAINNEPVILNTETDNKPDKASTEPEERSNIPEIINIVSPKAKIVVMEFVLIY